MQKNSKNIESAATHIIEKVSDTRNSSEQAVITLETVNKASGEISANVQEVSAIVEEINATVTALNTGEAPEEMNITNTYISGDDKY